jgi:hypothetical protein
MRDKSDWYIAVRKTGLFRYVKQKKIEKINFLYFFVLTKSKLYC